MMKNNTQKTSTTARFVAYWICGAMAVGCAEADISDLTQVHTDGDTHTTTEATMHDFVLKFAPAVGTKIVGCTDELPGYGQEETHSVAINDLRFFISNVAFYDADGATGHVMLAHNDFQYHSDDGNVSLIDLTNKTGGSCENPELQSAIGTARTNVALSGQSSLHRPAKISFDIGVPQALMRSIVANHTIEDAPSPLGELAWSWAAGYRHFLFNFDITDGDDTTGEGYFHIGSTGCAGSDGKALSDLDSCERANTATVSFAMDLSNDVVGIDLDALLNSVDMLTFSPEGTASVGAACHSMPMQPDCTGVLGAMGIDGDGSATASKNSVFVPLSDKADQVKYETPSSTVSDDTGSDDAAAGDEHANH